MELRAPDLQSIISNLKLTVMPARRYLVSGDVQGVGFRYFVLREVQRIQNIAGFVRNRYDGRVEVYAEANEAELAELEAVLRVGPRSGHVDKLQVIDEAAEGRYTEFQIIHSA
jgi:acylphosphatase